MHYFDLKVYDIPLPKSLLSSKIWNYQRKLNAQPTQIDINIVYNGNDCDYNSIFFIRHQSS